MLASPPLYPHYAAPTPITPMSITSNPASNASIVVATPLHASPPGSPAFRVPHVKPEPKDLQQQIQAAVAAAVPLVQRPDAPSGKFELRNLLERYQQLGSDETKLFQRMVANCSSCNVGFLKNLGMELHTILNLKLIELQSIVGCEDLTSSLDQVHLGPPRCPSPTPISVPAVAPITATPVLACSVGNGSNSSSPSASALIPAVKADALIVEGQPSGNVVANKYLEPPLVVRVDRKYLPLAKEGKLEVVASLCVTLSDEILSKTTDNKQNILQGNTIVTVTTEGTATFNKLKIMEVSSKHHHQAFSVSLQLQEIRKGNPSQSVPIGESVKSSALHVQSRMSKRKRSSSQSSKPKKRVRGEAECNYVDITPLLVLPQKEAASRLGISESMLCKRFKECTRRKWPYRYLRKIDKMLRLLTVNKKDEIAIDDQHKIIRLQKEREECLYPVKIRITGNDKISSNLSASGFRVGRKSRSAGDASESESEEGSSNSSPYEEEEEVEAEVAEDDEIAQVASTLNLLRQGESVWS
eukprot:TRINITY_DN7344_c0_g1_i1.p1 TRINITY_DN7344_c0_g1~~TRINITY_DN7344_c0_g1_i1.p1  ORF type:complete len:527 (+),score=25.69 TRINITY_DN7344_c0_g1_i1:152-1732(+)